jgi:hypothetical protein
VAFDYGMNSAVKIENQNETTVKSQHKKLSLHQKITPNFLCGELIWQ